MIQWNTESLIGNGLGETLPECFEEMHFQFSHSGSGVFLFGNVINVATFSPSHTRPNKSY